MQPKTAALLLSVLASGAITMAARSALETEQYRALADQLHFDPATSSDSIQKRMEAMVQRQADSGGDDSGGDDSGGDDSGGDDSGGDDSGGDDSGGDDSGGDDSGGDDSGGDDSGGDDSGGDDSGGDDSGA